MSDFIIKKLPNDPGSHASRAFVGKYLKFIKINSLMDSALPAHAGAGNTDVPKTFYVLLRQVKNDFDAIENFRDNKFYNRAREMGYVLLSPTWCRRLEINATDWFDLVAQINQKLLTSHINDHIYYNALDCDHSPIDMDPVAIKNSVSKKEWAGRTQASVDGSCSFAVCLGSPGCRLELTIRPGVKHAAAESENNLPGA